jgi:hypothetical protein
MNKRQYVFGESKGKGKSMPDSKYARELRALMLQQKRWLTRIRRAMTAISKIERRIKRLES